MKSLVLFLSSILVSLTALAATSELTEAIIFDSMSDVWTVESIEKVFEDEVLGEQVYKVSFSYVTEWDCASNTQVDFCGPKNDDSLVATCEYFKWNSEYQELNTTGVNCSEPLDTVVDEKLEDEY